MVCSRIWFEAGSFQTPIYGCILLHVRGTCERDSCYSLRAQGSGISVPGTCSKLVLELIAWACVRLLTPPSLNFLIYKTREWAQPSDFTKKYYLLVIFQNMEPTFHGWFEKEKRAVGHGVLIWFRLRISEWIYKLFFLPVCVKEGIWMVLLVG